MTFTMTNSTLAGNTASGNGGAIYNSDSSSKRTITNSTFTGNTASNDNGGAIYNSGGTLTVMNSTLTGNSGQDVYKNSGTVYMYYSLVGSVYGDLSQNVATRLAAPQDVFEYDKAGEIVLENGIPVISATGLAATTGALVGQIGADWYYVDKVYGMWRKVTESSTTLMAFNDTAADFGLTGGTIVTTAQNVEVTDEPVSRVLNAAVLEFVVGAYAFPRLTAVESVSLNNWEPLVGDSITATVSPKDATCDYQWNRVDGDGIATAIPGATSATYEARLEDLCYALRVVVSGNGDYGCVVSAQTAPTALARGIVVEEASPDALVYAVNVVANGGTVMFADNLAGSTITLTGAQIELNKNITIDAGDLGITIDADEQSRIFYIGSGYEVALNGLTLT
ncbi:MAG: hypothetical protein HUK22_03655, partial [Thermoguttaceae bacterium]|nr:hypothetical protein [Thermoguttaceae bacterium]